MSLIQSLSTFSLYDLFLFGVQCVSKACKGLWVFLLPYAIRRHRKGEGGRGRGIGLPVKPRDLGMFGNVSTTELKQK